MSGWEEAMRADWADASAAELLDEVMRLRRGMEGVRMRALHNHRHAAEALHCWTWNGCEPADWEPSAGDYGYADEMAYRAHVSFNERLRDIARTAAAAGGEER